MKNKVCLKLTIFPLLAATSCFSMEYDSDEEGPSIYKLVERKYGYDLRAMERKLRSDGAIEEDLAFNRFSIRFESFENRENRRDYYQLQDALIQRRFLQPLTKEYSFLYEPYLELSRPEVRVEILSGMDLQNLRGLFEAFNERKSQDALHNPTRVEQYEAELLAAIKIAAATRMHQTDSANGASSPEITEEEELKEAS